MHTRHTEPSKKHVAAKPAKPAPTPRAADPRALAKVPRKPRMPEPAPRHVAGARSDDGEAFLHDPQGGPAHATDQLAETLAEEFLQSATSAQEVTEEVRDAVVPEELGGPFVQATAEEEFADDVDEMNPPEAERAPFPTAIRLDKS
jgi:hypothetical protein